MSWKLEPHEKYRNVYNRKGVTNRPTTLKIFLSKILINGIETITCLDLSSTIAMQDRALQMQTPSWFL